MEKNFKRLTKITYGISFIIFLVIFLWGMLFLDSGNEMGYVVLNFYIIMPVTSLIMGIVLGSKNAYLKWAYPILFGALGIIIPYLVFKGSWDWISLFFSFLPALLGLIIGIFINKHKKV